MEQLYRVVFKTTGLNTLIFKEEITKILGNELLRVYNVFAERCNDGVTNRLNEEFDKLYPNYNSDKEWYEQTEYLQFMADGYNRLVVDDINKQNMSEWLEFYVDPEETQFAGRLKGCNKVTIQFYMEEVEA